MELSPERAAINGIVSHSVMKSAVFSGSLPLRVRWEWPRASHLVLILHGTEDMVYGNFERGEVRFLSLGLGRVPWELFVDCAGSSVLILLWEGKLWLRFSPLSFPLEEQSTAF